MGIIRDGFVVLRNWATAINKLPEENQLECYKALAEYGLTGKRPEKMSPVVDAMIESFSVGMENAIERYNASVENGKKGGAPLGNQNARKNVDNSTQNNLKQPKTTTIEFENNQEQPKTSENNPNVNVNDISLSRNNKINNSCGAGAREEDVDNSEEQRAFWKNHFSDFWKFNATNDERKSLALEVTDVIIRALKQATSEQRMTYNHHKYDYGELFGLFNGLDSEDFGKIVWSLQDAEIRQSRELYILGALLNKAKENKLAQERKHSLPEIGR